MRHCTFTFPRGLRRAALGLLLATAGTAQAQTAVTFAAAAAYGTGGSFSYSIAAADVNGDGWPDLLTTNQSNSTAGVLLGTGTGTFQAATTYSTGGVNPQSIAVADVNGDGRPDLLTTNRNSGTAGVLLGTGTGTFQAVATYSTGGNGPQSIAVADVNGDGRPDLLTANSGNGLGDGTAGVLLNTTVFAPTLASISPTPAAVGTRVTLTGSNLSGATAVTFAGTLNNTVTTGLTVSGSGSSQTLTVVVPSGATTGPVTVTTPGGTSNGVAFTVLAPVTLTTASPLPGGMVGTAYSQPFTATGGTAPYTYSLAAGQLPPGLTLASTGTLSGTPTQSGIFAFTVRATDASTGSGPYSGEQAYSLTIAAAPVASGLSVRYQTGDLGQPADGQVRPFLQLVNSGSTAVPYSGLTIRYWLTVENFRGQLVTPIDYAKLGTSFVSARYVALASPQQGAYGYIEYAFSAAAGSLAPGTDSGPIYGKAYKPDYSTFDETDDWSYQTSSSFTTNDHVTLYQNGTLIGGTEPAAVTATTALQVLSASRDASASTQYISLQLQVRNTGNLPIDYSQLRVRYYFTRDGAQTVVPELDYAQLGNSNVSLRVITLPASANGADAYLEVAGLAGAGVFYPRSSTGDILLKLRKADYSAFDQSNDYSFTGATSLTVNNRITALASNIQVFGTAPAGAPPIVAPADQPTSARASASADAEAASIVAASNGSAQALTASPNPFGEQLMLRFALPTTQAYSLALYDAQGRLVQQVASGQAEAGQAQELAVPTQGYAAGLYLVRLTTASGTQSLKLLKQ